MMLVNNTGENVPSLALQRLFKAIEIWDLEKHVSGYEWLYLCARHCGEELSCFWISSAENATEAVELGLRGALHQATSFQLEMLHSPRARSLSRARKDQWNSLRGKQAMMIDIEGKVTRWAAMEMIARNLSFNGALERHLIKVCQKQNMQDTLPVTLYQTRQLFCDNTPASEKQAIPVEIFRGNRVVEAQVIDRQSVVHSAQAMTRWLVSQVNEEGAASYKYWPSRGSYAASNNAIRQWMATVCLNRAAKAFANDSLATVAARNLRYNLSTTFRKDEKQGYIWMSESAKLGAAALAALAILESPQRKHYIEEEYSLYALLQHLSNPDGSFNTFYIPCDRKDNQNFYSGEALLFLASRYSVSRNPKELSRIMNAFFYYRDWHRTNRNPAFIPWHTQAYYLVWQVTKNEDLRDFIFEMNDWLLGVQQWDSAEFPDMQGRFYDPDRPHFGPPHASSTGVYLEGLIDAFALAQQCGDDARIENYRVVIVRGIRSIMQLQFKDEIDCFYIKQVGRVLGGVRATVYDNTIRIDNVQHALMALLKVTNLFSHSDYKIMKSTVGGISGSSVCHKQTYKHFKKKDFPICIENIRLEINRNNGLWFDNVSRQKNINVQRETHTIFLRAARKPFPPQMSGNDIHISDETANALYFPLLMKTLHAFADSVRGQLARVNVVRLQPESRVYPHIDEGEYYKYRDRYHIVVHSPAGSEMIAGGERVVWREGEFWWFDNKAIHEAYNNSREHRVHVIFDVLPLHNKSIVYELMLKNGELVEGSIE